MATQDQLAHLRAHNPIIAKIPRGPRNYESAMQSRYANAVRWAKQRGEYDETWNKAAYRAGFETGLRVGTSWSPFTGTTSTAPGSTTTTPKRK